jgi:hypothetical protein
MPYTLNTVGGVCVTRDGQQFRSTGNGTYEPIPAGSQPFTTSYTTPCTVQQTVHLPQPSQPPPPPKTAHITLPNGSVVQVRDPAQVQQLLQQSGAASQWNGQTMSGSVSLPTTTTITPASTVMVASPGVTYYSNAGLVPFIPVAQMVPVPMVPPSSFVFRRTFYPPIPQPRLSLTPAYMSLAGSRGFPF